MYTLLCVLLLSASFAFSDTVNINGTDIDVAQCGKMGIYSGHDQGYQVLTAAGAGTVFGFFALVAIFLYLDKTKTEREVMGIKLYDLRYPALGIAIFLFLIGPPMLVTGAYYGKWSKVYDVQDGCDDLPTISVDANISDYARFTPVNMTIAYVGDSGASAETLKVYQLIASEGAELVVQVGDLDYCDDSTLLVTQLDATLGNIPFLPVVGNHDLHVWGDYLEVLQTRWARTVDTDVLQCDGILFTNYWCIYKGLFIAFSSVGTKCGDGYTTYTWHEDQLEAQLALADDYGPKGLRYVEPWITCAWHKNQEHLQLGDKGDETGYGVYDLCRREGALIVNGHSHVYARTHGMGQMSQLEVTDSCTSTLDDTGVCIYNLFDNEAIVVTVGLGGFQQPDDPIDFNQDLVNEPQWAAKYNSMSGALFCVYNYQGFDNLAYCYFKTTNGDVVDEFYYTQRGGQPVGQ